MYNLCFVMKLCIYDVLIYFITIIISSSTVFAGVLFVHQPSANHAPRASVTQVNHSVHTLSTFLQIHTVPMMQIFWNSVTVTASDTFFMISTIPFPDVPSTPTTTGITVFICHKHSLYFQFPVFVLALFSIYFRAMFVSVVCICILISLQVEFTESLITMSGLFAVIVLSVLIGMSHVKVMLFSLLCITVSGSYWYHLSVILIS